MVIEGATDARCPYCHQWPERCAEINATRLDAWQALHYNDPEEITRRDDERTAEMRESLRQARTVSVLSAF